MPARIVLASVVPLSLVAAVSTAQTPSAVGAASTNPADRVVLVGCVVHEGEGLLLRAIAPDVQTRRRSAGSNSAKGSTPIAPASDLVVLKTSAGSNSAKGSTPIPISVGAGGERTSTVMSAKGSVPTAPSAASFVSYELDLARAQFSQPPDHVVEIRGRVAALAPASPSSLSSARRRVLVESVTVLPSMCAP